ncbi:MAG: GatB/YqeY domain-containing protein [bacterium]|nr:GatB/YqeY domain-containing protein [bacterium]
MLYDKLTFDLKTAMKVSAHERTSALRFVIAQIRNREIEKRTKGNAVPLTDDEIIDVMKREVKRRVEAVKLFRAGKREELARKEEVEIAMIKEYLPPELTHAEIAAIVDGIWKRGMRDFNLLIREAMKEVKGRADGEAVKDAIKAKIDGLA